MASALHSARPGLRVAEIQGVATAITYNVATYGVFCFLAQSNSFAGALGNSTLAYRGVERESG